MNIFKVGNKAWTKLVHIKINALKLESSGPKLINSNYNYKIFLRKILTTIHNSKINGGLQALVS